MLSAFKPIKNRLSCIVLASALLTPLNANAIELENRNMCSSGITNMMSSMGLMAYSMADFMNGMCKSIPFFGMFCPNLDKMAGSFFSKVLENPDLTLDLLACADHNPSMLSFMLKIMDKNPPLLKQMGSYMGQTGDGTSKGCLLGEQFTEMATRHSNLKNFFFAKIDMDLYKNYANNVFYCKADTVLSLSELIKANPKQSMAESSAFGKVMRNIHPPGTAHDAPGGHDHSLHDANERMFYKLFSNVQAGLNFMNGLSQIDAADQQSMMNFLFLGQVKEGGTTCRPYDRRCTPSAPVQVEHPYESTYYMYAMIKAMADGIVPAYQMDAEHPPAADSNVPANALFGQFMPLLLTEDHQINAYGMSFFKALISGYLTHGWQPSQDVTQHMVGLVNLGHVPFTMADMGNLMSQLNDPCSPDPAILFMAKEDEHHNPCEGQPDDTDTTPAPVPVVTTKTFTGHLAWYDDMEYGPFQAGTQGITVKVTGSGDVNLYVSHANSPRYRYDCISNTYGTSIESCQLTASGSYYILIDGNGRANSSDYSVTITY